MGGIRDMESFFASAGYAVLYLYLMQAGIRAIAHFSRQGTLGLTIGGFAFFVLSLSAGYVLHPKDIGSWVSWTAYLSPVAWILPPIAKFEFANAFFELCSNPIVKLRGNLLMVRKISIKPWNKFHPECVAEGAELWAVERSQRTESLRFPDETNISTHCCHYRINTAGSTNCTHCHYYEKRRAKETDTNTYAIIFNIVLLITRIPFVPSQRKGFPISYNQLPFHLFNKFSTNDYNRSFSKMS